MLHAAEVAQALLADDPDEVHVVVRLDPGFLHRAQHRQHHHQAAGVVPNAGGEESVAAPPHRHVGAFREDRVEVAAESDSAPAAPSPAQPDHVPLRVGPHRVGAELHEQFGEAASPRLLHERRRGYLGEFDERLQRPRIQLLGDLEGPADPGVVSELPGFAGVFGGGGLTDGGFGEHGFHTAREDNGGASQAR